MAPIRGANSAGTSNFKASIPRLMRSPGRCAQHRRAAVVAAALAVLVARGASQDVTAQASVGPEEPGPVPTEMSNSFPPAPAVNSREPVFAIVGQPVSVPLEVYGWALDPAGEGCTEAWWDLGDGTRTPIACPFDSAAAGTGYPPPIEISLEHTYDAPGNYFPTIYVVSGSAEARPVVRAEVAVAVRRESPGRLTSLWRSWMWQASALMLLGLALVVLRTGAPRLAGIALLAVSVVATLPLHQRDSSVELQPHVAGLVGRTGLDPLRPDDPVADAYVSGSSPWRLVPRMTVDVEYQSGARARYSLPQYEPRGSTLSPFYHFDGLGRLRTQHVELPGIPFAQAARDGIGTGIPEPLPLSDAPALGNSPWLHAACAEGGNLVAAPDERSILLAATRGAGGRALWLADLRSGRIEQLSTSALNYRWAPDGASLAVVAMHNGAPLLELWRREAGGEWSKSVGPVLPANTYPDISGDRVFVRRDRGVWSLPTDERFDRGEWELAVELEPAPVGDQGAGQNHGTGFVRLSPDGSKIAYRCESDTCILALGGEESDNDVAGDVTDDDRALRVAVAAVAAEWSRDGSRIALLESRTASVPESRNLHIVAAGGKREHRLALVPGLRTSSSSEVGDLAWSTNGSWLFAATCPLDGRRMIAVDVRRGAVVDLTQPLWDAWATYLPESGALALWNGRGGVWRAPLHGSRVSTSR